MSEIATIGKSLVERARMGDRCAFSLLVEEHYKRVWRFLLKWVRNPHDAEELAQETFLAAWRRLSGFRGESQFSTWLLGIALNLARNHHNRSSSQHEDELQEEAHLQALSLDDPCDLLQQKTMLVALDAALSRLPQEMREVMLLVRLEGLSLDEAASILDIPLGTVKSRLARARGKLREEMEDYFS